jgi:HK97 family phage major capsid protein
MSVTLSAPEMKAEAGVAEAFEALSRTFEAFKETNDTRLGEMERRMAADPITEDKLIRLDAAVDAALGKVEALSLKARRPQLGGDAQELPVNREHKAAFEAYMRGGDAGGLRRLETKTLAGALGPDGGYLVPMTAEREILRRMAASSPIRGIASVRQISTSSFRKAFAETGPAAGWTGAGVNSTPPQQLSDLSFGTFELFAQPAATQTLLDDATVDVERWIAEEAEVAFAEKESAAFVNGNGTSAPQGFLTVPQVANASWAWGSLGTVNSGASGAFPATDPGDALTDLVYALKAGYRQNGSFVMNRKTQSVVRKIKDADGRYLWSPPSVAGAPSSLMNFPVVEAEDMPDIAAGSTSIAFGDFRRGYLVLDRMGIRILRDPFSAKPYVLFYTTKRVGGGVQDFDAIKLMKFSA